MKGFGNKANKKSKNTPSIQIKKKEVAQSLASQALKAYQSSDLASAHMLLEKANTIQPNDAFIIGFLATIEKAQGNTENAINLFEISLSLNPNDPSFLHNYAQLLIDRNIKKALLFSELSVSLSPNNPAYLERLGFIRFDKKYIKI